MSEKKQTILIVDDESINIDILSTELSQEYQILVAKNGRQALKRVEDNPVDLILLDIVMPEMSGYEIITILKNQERTKGIPVIFITAKNESEDEARGLHLGAVDYIKKPFDLSITRARVKTHLDLKWKTDLLEQLASLDGLTNLYNRRKFDETLVFEWKKCLRSGASLSLIMIDIDFFKGFNDCYGHTAGDDCLRKVSRALISQLQRPDDFLGRYGGEEFVALLPNTDCEGALFVAERLRNSIEELGIPHSQSEICKYVTISLGASTILPTIDVSPNCLLECADRMLYQSKEAGRNQVQYQHIEKQA